MRLPLESWSNTLRRLGVKILTGGGRKNAARPKPSPLAFETLEDRTVLTGDSPWYHAAMPGDVNGNGSVTADDVWAVVNVLLSNQNYSIAIAPNALPPNGNYADANNNGIANIDDFYTVLALLNDPNATTINWWGGGGGGGTLGGGGGAPQPIISIDWRTVLEGDASGKAAVTVRLSATTTQAVTVEFSTSDSTAHAGSDYLPAVGTLTIAAGNLTGIINVDLVNDTLSEGPEDFFVTLANPTNATLLVPNAAAQVTILDDDPLPAISIEPASAMENAALGKALFSVHLSAPATQVVTLHYATSSGTALPGADYVEASGTLSIPIGEVVGVISIDLVNDSVNEPTEQFFVSLSNPVNATLSAANTAEEVTIVDDDPLPEISIGNASGDESAGTFSFPVTLSAPSGQIVRVNYATQNGTTNVGASFDQTPVQGFLTFNPGEVTKTITVSILDDVIDEDNEVFYINLSTPIFATIDDGQGAGTILDNDASPQVTITGGTQTEGTGPLPFTVTLSAASERPIHVDWNTAHISTTNGDFTAGSGTLLFSIGTLSKTLPIAITDDGLDEADEQFEVDLSNPTNATLGFSFGVGNIIDNDVLVKPANQTNREGQTVSVQLAGDTPAYVAGGGVYSATGLPSGLSVDAMTGEIKGKITYTAFDALPNGIYNVTVDRENNAGVLLGSVNFTWTVTDSVLTSVTGRELIGTTITLGVTVTGLTTETLYYSPGHNIQVVLCDAVLPPNRADILYNITGQPNGNLGTDFTFPPNGGSGTVLVGIDSNLNGVLDGNEGTHSFDFAPISLSAASFAAQRTSGPAELQHFEINEDDHFEVGGTFNTVMSPTGGGAFGDHALLRWRLINANGSNETIKDNGQGLNFNHTFTATDKGWELIRLYNDANNDQQFNSATEASVDSVPFWVMDKKVYQFSVYYSDAIPGGDPSATIANELVTNSNLLLRKDSPDDNRAAVEIKLSTLTGTSFVAGGSFTGWDLGTYRTPDPIATAVDYNDLFMAAGNWKIIAVNQASWDGGLNNLEGLARVGDPTFKLIYNMSNHRPDVLAHEFGHLVGLNHAGGADFIMADGLTRHQVVGGDRITQDEAKAYDKGQ